MPEVGDNKYPYTEQGIKSAKQEAEKTGQKVEGIPVQDATSRGKSYAIGGKIPGEEGFGVNPDIMNNMTTELGMKSPMNPKVSNDDEEEDMGMYKEGGKVRRAERKAKRQAKRKNRKQLKALKKLYKIKKGDIRRQAKKGSKDESVQEHYGTKGDRKATKKAIKAKLKEKRERILKKHKEGKLLLDEGSKKKDKNLKDYEKGGKAMEYMGGGKAMEYKKGGKLSK